ncbi:phosphoribosylaminoimidazolesuccinocarboxamide synthase [bacterium]
MNKLPLNLLAKGKVRDIYDLDDKLLIITSDRISAFDHVLPTLIPDKGKSLTKLSVFWFHYLKDVGENHLISSEVDEYPEELKEFRNELEGRSMLVKKAKRIDLECIVRGYIAGSGWKEYQNTSTVCGIELPKGLRNSDKLPEPIFTPSTKAEVGDHDENISEERAIQIVGKDVFEALKKKSIAIYQKASEYALTKGIIIADTKFEFGFVKDEIILIDEVLTPDSSRFWDVEKYTPGKSQDSYDKQYVRDYLEQINWDKKPPVPILPEEVVVNTQKKYEQICDLLSK